MQQLDSLPADVAAEIRPFLVRPTDPDSAFSEPAPGAAVGRGTTYAASYYAPYAAANFVCEPNGWGHIDSGPVSKGPGWKIWAICNDPSAVSQAVEADGWMAGFWDEEVKVMRPPMGDGGLAAEGGDGPIDVYVLNDGQCQTNGRRCLSATTKRHIEIAGYSAPVPTCVTSGAANKCSGYIVLLRSRWGPDTPSTLAHELFHVVQNAYNAYGTLKANGTWNWFVEASAKWAQWRWYPPARPDRVNPYLLNFLGTDLGLTTTNFTNEYASFTWPLFMQKKAGGDKAIADAWQAIEGKVDADVDDAIAGVLSFAANFKDFAVTGWNEPLTPPPDPVSPHFWDLDGGLPKDQPFGGKYRFEILPANARGAPPLTFHDIMPPVSARYAELVPDKGVHQVTIDFSGLAPPDYLDVEALLDIKDHWTRRPLTKGENRFCLDEANDAVKKFIIVLANHETREGATLQGDWKVESLIDPCTGWDVTIEWTDVYDGVFDTITFSGVVDTVVLDNPTPEGTLFMEGKGTATGSRRGWKDCNPGITVTPSGSVPATFLATVTHDTITVAAFADPFTALAGVATGYFEAPLNGDNTVDVPPGTAAGEVCPHYSFGTAEISEYKPAAPP